MIAWSTMTPNSNIPCGKLWKFSQFKPHMLPGTSSHSVAHKTQALWSYWGDHGAADAWGRSLHYLLYFIHHGMWWNMVWYYFQSKLPSNIIPSQKHLLLILPTLPGGPWPHWEAPSAAVSLSLELSCPSVFPEAPLIWMSKKTFWLQCWENSNQTSVFCIMRLLLRIVFTCSWRRWWVTVADAVDLWHNYSTYSSE